MSLQRLKWSGAGGMFSVRERMNASRSVNCSARLYRRSYPTVLVRLAPIIRPQSEPAPWAG